LTTSLIREPRPRRGALARTDPEIASPRPPALGCTDDVADLVITTSYHLLRVSFTEAQGFFGLRPIWSKGGLFFGCTWDERCLYVGCRNSHVGGVLNPRGESILRFDNRLAFKDVWFRSRALADVHQICRIGGDIWATNTYYNSLLILNRQTAASTSYAPLGKSTEPGSAVRGDINHYNTIRYDGRTVYVIASNINARTGAGNRRRSELLLIDPLTRVVTKKFQLQGLAAHDIWKERHEYLSLASDRGGVCGNARRTRWQFKPWLRGLAIWDHLMFCGWTPVNADRNTRAKRDTTAIIVVNRNTDRVIDRLDLRCAGEVNDVMILNQPDQARFNQEPFHRSRAGRPAKRRR